MKIIVKAKPGAKEDKVEKIDDSNYVVYVKERPVDGRANGAIIALLAEHFKTNRFFVEIVSGHKSKIKVIKIIT